MDVVSIYHTNSWEWIVSYFSITRIGAIINPINNMLAPSEIKNVVNACKAKAILKPDIKKTLMHGGIIATVRTPTFTRKDIRDIRNDYLQKKYEVQPIKLQSPF